MCFNKEKRQLECYSTELGHIYMYLTWEATGRNWKRAAAQKNAAVKAEQAEQQAERKTEHTFLHADFHKICSKISDICSQFSEI